MQIVILLAPEQVFGIFSLPIQPNLIKSIQCWQHLKATYLKYLTVGKPVILNWSPIFFSLVASTAAKTPAICESE